jgi:methylated-DNA-[protein]-cysteine S-methyltransferase
MIAPFAIAPVITPIGLIIVTAQNDVLTGLQIASRKTLSEPAADHPLLREATRQIEDWFAGKRSSFDLPLQPMPSPRGEALRAAIAAIPFGQTLTYGGLATKIGSAARAVGQACRRNPFPLIIPCHRVVSSGGTEFYSGGDGPRTKAWLTAFEQGKAYDYDTIPHEQHWLL